MPRRQFLPTATIVALLFVALATPTMFLFLSSTAAVVGAQEQRPKVSFDRPERDSETAPNSRPTSRRASSARPSGKQVAKTALPQKPSGKMEFVPDESASRSARSTATARSAANSVARRNAADQSAKVAVTPTKSPAGLRSKNSRVVPPTAPSVAPVVIEEPIQVAKELIIPAPQSQATPESIVAPEPVTEPELVAETDAMPEPDVEVAAPPAPPVQLSERPEVPIPLFELPIVRQSPRPSRTLDDEISEAKPAPAARSVRDVVQLELDDNDLADNDAEENMELADVAEGSQQSPPRTAEPTSVFEIQTIAAQQQPEESPATNAAGEVEAEVAAPKGDVLAELKPISSIEIRKAVQVPQLAESENQQLNQPADQARAYLRDLKRPAFTFWPVYRDPWTANRDSYAFHHNPLWFKIPTSNAADAAGDI